MKKLASPQRPVRKTKDRIIDAAQSVFAKLGFETASMSRIAAAACIDKSSLYYFFRNKEDLFAEVTLHFWREAEQSLQKDLMTAKTKNGGKILSVACQHFIKISRDAGVSMTRMELPKSQNSLFKETLQIIQSIRSRIVIFLKNQKVPDPELAHVVLLNAIHSYILHCGNGKRQPTAKHYCDYISSLLIP